MAPLPFRKAPRRDITSGGREGGNLSPRPTTLLTANPIHVSDHDLERYHLGMLTDDQIAVVEEHYLGCPECAERAEAAADYVDTVRGALVNGTKPR